MGTYSPEPSRRTCTLHVPLNHARGDDVPDASPHDNNATLQGGTFVDGPIGRAIYFDEISERVEINNDVPLHRDRAFTVAAWARPEPDRQGSDDTIVSKSGEFSLDNAQSDNGVSFTLEDANGNVHTIEHDQYLDPGTYTHVAGTYDGMQMRLYVDGEEVASTMGGFDINTSSSSIYIGQGSALSSPKQFIGAVSDVRTYREPLGEDEINDLVRLGTEHWAVDPVRQSWDNDGIPLRKENLQMAGALSESDAYVRRQLDYIHEARFIEDAAGHQLDRIGSVAGVTRREGESDAVYRGRIIGTVAAGRSRGTYEDILNAAAAVVGIDSGSVELDTNYSANPATVQVYIPNAAIEDSELDTNDISSILDDAVIAGHTIEVFAAAENPFTLRDDSQTNDASLGLTSDSTSDGGELVEDV